MIGDSLSAYNDENIGSERNNRSAPFNSYSDVFYEQFPYYLSIGMTEEQYWDKDPMLVKYYRKAEEIRIEKMNSQAWLQGLYVYDAISRIAPVLQAFAKKGTKAKPYVDEPYAVTEKSVKEAEQKKEKARKNKAKTYMETFMTNVNSKFKGK